MNRQIGDEAVDYRKMYYHLSAAVEDAIRILIAAQQHCEDILLDADDSPSDSSD